MPRSAHRFQILLIPTPGAVAVDESGFGGPLLWPKDEPWPKCPGRELATWAGDQPNDYMVALLQVFRHDFPELPFPDQTDILQILWCPRHHRPPGPPACPRPAIKTIWRSRLGVEPRLQKFPVPSSPDQSLMPRSCQLHPDRTTTTTDWERLWQETEARFPMRLLGAVTDLVHGVPDLRCQCRARMQALFTFSAEDGSDAFPPAAWLAQVVVCTRCPHRPTKSHYLYA